MKTVTGDDETGLGFDPQAAVAHLRKSDPILARLIDAVGPFQMQLELTSSVFLSLAEAIVYQQLNGKAAASIFAWVRALFPDAVQGPMIQGRTTRILPAFS